MAAAPLGGRWWSSAEEGDGRWGSGGRWGGHECRGGRCWREPAAAISRSQACVAEWIRSTATTAWVWAARKGSAEVVAAVGEEAPTGSSTGHAQASSISGRKSFADIILNSGKYPAGAVDDDLIRASSLLKRARSKDKQPGEGSSKSGSGKSGSRNRSRGQRKKKAGGSSNVGNAGSGGSGGVKDDSCLKCRKKGHWARDYRSARRKQANMARDDDSDESLLMACVISFTRGPFLFVFNFNPDVSHRLYHVGVDEAGEYQLILNTDETKYGGCGELKSSQYMRRTSDKRVDGCRNCLELTLPCRSAQVYKLARILRI
ncbi:hypothetical protein PR202_gb23429 [Eleusine coracana subsp. coracana]|uniref:Alpha-amylase/branching enzyme C-terminal all beta domain-containing protein n=1 Tax=Eleusine coracana subsp. coracana TaxID=191504 RepID=A0AAV5FG90_ELECO|nr:hypothetical protein PR202_gb23429 [Eleusine coracana subsp. coracana]